MSEKVDVPTLKVSANCLPDTPLFNCTMIFTLSVRDNTTRFLLEDILVKNTHGVNNTAKYDAERTRLRHTQ